MKPAEAYAITYYRLPLRKRIRRTLRALAAWLCSPNF